MKELGEFLKNKREQAGLSLREMFKKCGISASYLSDIETGNRPIITNSDKDLINTIAKTLNLTKEEYDELIKLSELDLAQRGKLTNETSNYLKDVPLASVALRTAKEKSLSEEDWKKIIEEIENR